MKKRLAFFLLLAFMLSVGYALSHEEEEEYDLSHSDLYPVDQLTAVMYGSSALGLLFIAIFLFHKQMSELTKKVSYFLVAAIALLVTLYLVLTTLHLNINSETKGPVHWHADFEIWVCGKEVSLAKPQKFLSNKQGTDLMHAHTDQRIHVEGVITDMKQASLGAFFYAVGGSISSDGIKVPIDEGLIAVHDGDKCNEQPARLYVFVNGNLIENPKDYAIAPFEKIPPGDRIKFVFTEKPVDETNPNIGGIPLGEESEKFFYEVNERLQNLPSGKEPMLESTQPLCDIDGDFDCDNDDLSLLDTFMGKCQRECHGVEDCKDVPSPFMDQDGDGCVTLTDRELFIQSISE